LKSDGAASLETYLKKNKLVVADEKMRLGKILAALDIFMAAALVIGVGFVIFSLVIIMLNFSLIVAQATEEVFLLLQLGYSGKQLIFHLTGYLIVFMGVVLGMSAVIVWFGNNWLVGLLISNGLSLTTNLSIEVFQVATGFVLLFFGLSFFRFTG